MQKQHSSPLYAIIASLFFAWSLFTQASAYAEAKYTGFNRSLDDNYSLLLGGYFSNVDSNYQGKGKRGRVSADLDLETLGLDDDEIQPFLHGKIRFNERWRLDLHAFGTDRGSTKEADFDVDLGEAGTIPVGVSVRTNFSAAIYAARVGYSFLRTPRSEIGAGFGLHVADLDVGISGDLNVGDSEDVPFTVSENADVLAPLPTVGLFASYAFTDTLSVHGQLGYFTLSYDKYDGSLVDLFAMIEYRPFENVGFGAGYSLMDADLGIDGDRKRDSFELNFKGPILYTKVGF